MRVNLEPDDLKDAYSDAQAAAKQYFEPFNEYERIASNKLRSDLPANMPKVNDGSLAALLQEAPMRVLAQMLTGKVRPTDRDEPWLTELANIIWSKKIVPNANTQAPFFNKLQIALYRALQYGSQPAFTFFTVKGSYRGADFVLPYIRDVFLEPGKASDSDSDYIFMNTWYTELQLKNLAKQAEEENSEAKKAKRESTNQWDVAKLKEVLKRNPDGKEQEALNRVERQKDSSTQNKAYKFVTCFQRGVDAPVYTFAPGMGLDKQVVRTGKNTDARGDLPIHFLYAFEDLTNPYGKGQVELSGGTQNVLDFVTQLHILGTQIGLQPPIRVAGDRTNTNLSSLVYSPSAYWFTGQAEVEPVQTANAVYSQFGNTYGLYKTQLLNLQGTSDASVSAESGAPGYSKTSAGVNLQQERTNAHDTFLRRQVNYFVDCLGSSMINTHMSNMQGTELMQLVDEEAKKLMQAGLIDEDPETREPSTQEVEVIWENMRGKFEFEVDPESSIAKDDDKQKERLLEMATLATENPLVVPALQQSGYDLKLGELFKRIFIKEGIDDWEKVLVPMSEDEQAAMQMEQQAQQMAAQQPQLPSDEPPMEQPMMQPPMPEPMPGIDPSLAPIIEQAQAQGFSPEEVATYLQAKGLA